MDLSDKKNAVDILKALAKKSYDIAFEAYRKDDFETTRKYRDMAIEDYYRALVIAREEYGEPSMQVAGICLEIGRCYKWMAFGRGTELTQFLETGFKYLLKAAEMYEKLVSVSKNNKFFANLYVDIGGFFYMNQQYDDVLPWRLKGYRAMISGEHDLEQLGKIEISILFTYRKTKSTVPYEEYMKAQGITPIIESVSEKVIDTSFSQFTVKLKGLEKPCVWELSAG